MQCRRYNDCTFSVLRWTHRLRITPELAHAGLSQHGFLYFPCTRALVIVTYYQTTHVKSWPKDGTWCWFNRIDSIRFYLLRRVAIYTKRAVQGAVVWEYPAAVPRAVRELVNRVNHRDYIISEFSPLQHKLSKSQQISPTRPSALSIPPIGLSIHDQ